VPDTIIAEIGIAVADNGKWQATGWSGEEDNAETALVMLRDWLDDDGERYQEIHTFTHRVEVPVPKVGKPLTEDLAIVTAAQDAAKVETDLLGLVESPEKLAELDSVICQKEYELARLKRLRNFAIAERRAFETEFARLESDGEPDDEPLEPERKITVTDTVTASRSVSVEKHLCSRCHKNEVPPNGKICTACDKRKQRRVPAETNSERERPRIPDESPIEAVAIRSAVEADSDVVLPAKDVDELAERVKSRLCEEIREYVEANPKGSKVYDIARGLQIERDEVLGVIAKVEGIKQNSMGFWFPVDA